MAGHSGHDHLERKPADAPHTLCVKCGSTDAPAARRTRAHTGVEASRCRASGGGEVTHHPQQDSPTTSALLVPRHGAEPGGRAVMPRRAGIRADPVCCGGRPSPPLGRAHRRVIFQSRGFVQGLVHRAQTGIDRPLHALSMARRSALKAQQAPWRQIGALLINANQDRRPLPRPARRETRCSTVQHAAPPDRRPGPGRLPVRAALTHPTPPAPDRGGQRPAGTDAYLDPQQLTGSTDSNVSRLRVMGGTGWLDVRGDDAVPDRGSRWTLSRGRNRDDAPGAARGGAAAPRGHEGAGRQHVNEGAARRAASSN